jgi:CheY-like chemotaxis protein
MTGTSWFNCPLPYNCGALSYKVHRRFRRTSALVTDINLKGRMDGWEAARQAREIDPEFPIVYISGASAADWPSKGVPNSVMLEKPFAPAQLVTAIANLLNTGTPSA